VTTLYTIGFTKKTARQFFTSLAQAKVSKLVDVRLNNVSQLAGFTKREDLRYFSETILQVPYEHDLELAPTQDLLGRYRKFDHDWVRYESDFLTLMEQRGVEVTHSPQSMDAAALLCTESTATRCHRRLVAEYLGTRWGADLSIVHL
jgi:uncharacterized protein (DUF488 family)